MPLFLETRSKKSLEPLVNGCFGEIPLIDAIRLAKSDVLKADSEREFVLRVLGPSGRP